MSFDVEKSGAEYKAHIKILTAWKIGHGPCGTSCTFDRIGQSTNQSRSMALNTHGKYYLGMWVAEREELHHSQHIYTDMTDEVTDHITEIVQFVNIKQDWEQEQAEITVSVQPNTEYVDVKFNGSFWVGSTGVGMAVTPSPASVINVYQPVWFMQCKITIAVRSDTNRSNRSPVLQMKPYYRLALGQKREMKVSYVDEDDDIVKCSIATIGTSNGIKAPTGISVNEKDCVIIFEISNNTYGLHDTGIVLIDVMDFNVKDMILGDGPDADKYPGSKTSSRSLSTVPLQFYFEVVDELNPPEFINPTPPNGQMFEIFVGAKFRVLVVARPTASNDSVLIDIIFFTQNLRFKFETSNITNRPDIDPRARSVTVTWLPTHNEIGKHLLCPNVLDNTGESNFEQYCFPVTVRDMPTRNVTALPGMPYFLQFPGNTDIICQVSSVCSFPIYAKTQDPGGITDISIVRPEIFNLEIVGQLKPAPTIDPDAKMIEVSFQDSRHGTKQFCVKASDQKTSIEQCTFITIKPVDPCMSAPCKNGECLSKEDGTYQCLCQLGFHGELCNIHPCIPIYCQNNGECEVTTTTNGNTGQCICPAGFTGDKCQTSNSEQVTPVELSNITSPEKPHFTATAVPKVINCVQDEPCHVPLTVTEPSGHTPSVKYGEVDPGLDTKKPVLTGINGTKDFTTDVVVTPQRPGSKKLCVQTQTSLGMNVDEICYEIHTSGPNSSLATKPTPTGSPIFTAPTVTESSTLICETGKVCHIPLTYQGLRGKCEEIIEAVNHQDGVHVFKPPVQPTAIDKTCTTDVAYKPPTAGTKELCFKPGPYGEERCLHIETKDNSLLNTSCQTLHCQNGGDCVAGVCVCAIGTAGLDCSQKTSISITEKGGMGKIVFTDTVLPQEVVCYKDENCTVPFVVTRPGATSNYIPVVYLQQTYTDLNPNLTSPTRIGNNTDSFRTELTLTPTTSVSQEVCLYLANSKEKTDLHCMKIAVIVRPTTDPVISPKFTAKTLYPDTLIACKVNAFCHLPMETELKSDKQCPTLSKDNSTTTTADIHPMETQTDGITCTTDVVIHPTKSETGLKQVCIQINVSPSEGPRCYRLNVTAENPCVSLYCQNQGECEVTNNTGQCICRAGFTGDKCQTLESKQVTPVNLQNVTDSEKPHFTSTAVPKIIKCVQNETCHVPLIVTEPSGQTPLVKYGEVDPGLDTKKPVLTPITGTKDFTTDVMVTPQLPGSKKLCVQTQTSHGMNVDEICYEIQTSASKPNAAGTLLFTAPTVTNSSTLICETGKACYIPLTYIGLNKQCEEILQSAGLQDGVHIFQPPVQPLDGTCTTDVAFKSPTAGTTELCFQPGSSGENRCVHIETKDKTQLNTSCQTLHCQNGGDCVSDKCICPIGKAGLDCSQTTTTPLLPLGCIDYEDDSFNCTKWNEIVGICKSSTESLSTIALQRCPKFCNICKNENVQPTPTVMTGQGCQDMPGVNCHTLSITNICSCNSAFGSKYCSNYCKLCSNLQILTPGQDFLSGK